MWLLAAVALLGIGDPLPPLKGEFLTGTEVPEVARGRVALLAFGFTYDSRFAVEAWVRRCRKEFPDRGIPLDGQGTVQWLYRGAFDETAFSPLAEAVRRLSP